MNNFTLLTRIKMDKVRYNNILNRIEKELKKGWATESCLIADRTRVEGIIKGYEQ